MSDVGKLVGIATGRPSVRTATPATDVPRQTPASASMSRLKPVACLQMAMETRPSSQQTSRVIAVAELDAGLRPRISRVGRRR